MTLKARLCTCQKFCQAPPEGKAIPERTWYNHAAQCTLEAEMTLEECEAQQFQRRKRPRNWRGDRVHAIRGSDDHREDVLWNTASAVCCLAILSYFSCRNNQFHQISLTILWT